MSSTDAVIAAWPSPEPYGAILWLWVCSAGAANLFALYWLFRALILAGLLSELRAKISFGRRWELADVPPCTNRIKPATRTGEVALHLRPALDRNEGVFETLEWRDLSYSVPVKGRTRKQLLRGVWGTLRSGELMALMGPSGAGKSTLLELLAMRRGGSSTAHAEVDAGQVQQPGLYLNGKPAVASKLKAISSWVPQDDVLLPQMSVLEVLSLHSALRLPHTMSAADKTARQEEVLTAMGLCGQRNQLVGGVLPGGILVRGLSGGERKRLALGTGLLPQPAFLFADEPTSGLDAFAALTVMSHLAEQAHGPAKCAVLVSIHQPRTAIWDMLDKVLLLAQGRMVYQGPTSSLQQWLCFTLPPLLGLAPNKAPFTFDPQHQGALPDWVMDLLCLTEQEVMEEQQLAVGVDKMIASSGEAVTTPKGQLGLLSAPEASTTIAGGNSNGNSSGSSTTLGLVEGKAALVRGDNCDLADQALHATPTTWVAHAADHFLVCSGLLRATVRDDNAAIGTTTNPVGFPAETPADVEQPRTPSSSFPDLVSAGSIVYEQQGGFEDSRAATGTGATVGVDGVSSALPPPTINNFTSRALGRWWTTYKALVWREALAAIRNPADVAGRMLTFVWVAMLGNFLLYGGSSERENAGSIRIRLASLYFMLFFFMVMPFLFISVFTADKRLYIADVASRLYKPGPYYLAKVTATLPLNTLISLSFALTAYGMFGYRHTALAVVQTAAVSVLFSLISLQWMFFASAISPTQDISFMLAVAFAIFNLLVNSFFIGPEGVSGWTWVRHLRYISAMDWSWQGVATAELKDRTFSCAQGGDALGLDALGLYQSFIPDTGQLQLIRRGLAVPGADCVAVGNVALQYYRVLPRVGVHVAALIVYLLVLHAATFLAMRVATHRATHARGSKVAG